jgi:hypothetical protein
MWVVAFVVKVPSDDEFGFSYSVEKASITNLEELDAISKRSDILITESFLNQRRIIVELLLKMRKVLVPQWVISKCLQNVKSDR